MILAKSYDFCKVLSVCNLLEMEVFLCVFFGDLEQSGSGSLDSCAPGLISSDPESDMEDVKFSTVTFGKFAVMITAADVPAK